MHDYVPVDAFGKKRRDDSRLFSEIIHVIKLYEYHLLCEDKAYLDPRIRKMNYHPPLNQHCIARVVYIATWLGPNSKKCICHYRNLYYTSNKN